MKTVVIIALFTTLSMPAFGWNIIWNTSTQNARQCPKTFSGNYRHGHDRFCKCKFHQCGGIDPQTELARRVMREGGRIETVEPAGPDKLTVTTMTFCRMCNGTGRSMSKTCTSCKGKGVQVRKMLKAKKQ